MMRYDGHFRLAHELSKHLHEVMGWVGPMTHRQFTLWQTWLNAQLDIPSRDNYYQMQIACEQRRTFSKNPKDVTPDQFKLTFTSKDDTNKTQGFTRAQRIDMIKQRWFNRMTAPITMIRDGIQTETILPAMLRRRQELEKQIQNKRTVKRPPVKPTNPPEKKDTHGDDTGVRGVDGSNDGGRLKVPRNAGRRKRQDRE